MRNVCLSMLVLLVIFAPLSAKAQDSAPLCVVSPEELSGPSDEGTPPQESNPLEGNLGGNLDMFKDLYFQDDEFQQEGCSWFSSISSQPSIDGTNAIVTVIDLWADRNEDIEAGVLDKPSDANWTKEEASFIAEELVPTDTKYSGEYQSTEAGNLIRTGHSESLATVTTPEHYSYHGSSSSPGDVEVVLFLSSDGTVWNIVVQLGGIN